MPLLNAAAPDFNDPLGLLAACHQRMLGFCELLERLVPWIEANGPATDATDSAQRVLRYFNTAGVLHHQDEETDLFPMLDGDPELGPLIERLQQEHRELDRLWAALARQLDGLLNDDHDQAALQATVAAFCSAYRNHIDDENSRVLPQARKRLSDAQLRALGQSMAARRQCSGHATPGQ